MVCGVVVCGWLTIPVYVEVWCGGGRFQSVDGYAVYTVWMRWRSWVVCSTPALQCRDGRRIVMANTKEQQLQAFARRAARVSKALWPTNVRRSIATGRAAQTRRELIVKSRYGRWWWSSFALQHPLAFAGMCALGSACIIATLATHLWLLVLLFIVALVVSLFLVIVRTRASSMQHSMNSLQQGTERRSFPGVLGKAHFPNTPMPVEPPLVRVLETFDLSETNVEHFLELPEGGNTGGYSLESWKEARCDEALHDKVIRSWGR